jgi:radical SAM protein with 4Fe4S-binding SPASM domain
MTNKYVSFNELKQIKPTIMNFIKDSVSEGIKPGLECVLPPCIFTTSEWRYLILFTEALKAVCQPDLEVFPDLTVTTCVSMRGITPNFKVGRITAQDMIKNFLKDTQKFRKALLPECEDCEIFEIGGCQGYCLRFKKDFVKQGWRSLF